MSKIHYNRYGLSYTECGLQNSSLYDSYKSFLSHTNIKKDVTCKDCLKKLMADGIVDSLDHKIERRIKRGKIL